MSGQNYDPAQHDTQLVAAFERYDIAASAHHALLGVGLPAHAVELIGEPSPSGDGFWSAVRRLFAPDAEAHELGEAVHQGHVMVVVRPETVGERETAIEVLEGYGPIDLDRQSGAKAPSSSVQIVEERLRVGWRDNSRPASRVRRYVAERNTGGERVELHEEVFEPSADRRPAP